MCDEVAVVEQDPATLRASLSTDGLALLRRERLLDLLGDRPDLSLARGRADQEVVGDGQEVADVDDGDVLGLLVGRCSDGTSDPSEGRQRWDARAPFDPTLTWS